MGLFAPWFLAGALAVGLPVWLHLLKRSNQDPKLFPSLMFFEHRETSSVQHRKLDFITLFILRTLMLLLLALLFAQPFIRRSTPAQRGERLTVVAVDRSFSMRTTEGGTSRLDLAKTEAAKVLSGIPGGTKGQVVALSGVLEAMTQQVADPNELRAAVTAIKEGDSRADFGVLARYLRTLREQADIPLEVHVISDMQKSAMPPGFTDLRLDNGTKLVLHPIGKAQPNWSVEGVNAPQRIYDTKTVHVAATIAGFNAPASTRNVTLMLNGKVVGSKQVQVAENGRGSVEFIGLEASYGFNKCEIRIDASDTLAADDHFAFAVERTDPKRVLFIDDGLHSKSQRFFTAALTSDPDSEFAVESLRPEVAANADYSKYAVVVLSEPANLPSNLINALQKYVERGGGLFEALGVGSAVLNKAPVIDLPIQGTKLAASSGNRFWTVGDVDQNHAVLKNVERFEGVKFYQAVTLGAGEGQVLARLSDGTPLVVERRVGEGFVMAYAASLDDRQNDFSNKPIYVPFVQETVKYLGGGGVSQPVNLGVDSYVELRAGTQQQGVSAEVLDPDGQRVLSIEQAASAPNFVLSREGFFDVKNAAGRRTLVAAHADRRESDLTVMDKETQEIWAATGSEVEAAQGPVESGLNAASTPWSLAPYILVLLLIVALAESVFANRYLRSSIRPEETMTKV
ncbi:MAG: BatA domain-containing protein [Bryobacteraceae bacterium]